MSALFGGGGRLALLKSQEISSAVAQVDFTGLPVDAFAHFLLDFHAIQAATDNTALQLRLGMRGGTWAASAGDYRWSYAYANTGSQAGYGSASDAAIEVDRQFGSAANEVKSGFLLLRGLSSNDHKVVTFFSGGANAPAAFNVANGAGVLRRTGQVDALRLYMSSGNMASGAFKLYGVR